MGLLFGIITGIILLVLLVVIHELGHAISALRNAVVVEEFGVGFPPRAWKRKLKNGVVLSINWLPLGGFVKLQGEHDSAENKGDYGSATFLQKTKILLSGVLVNWIFAALLLSGLAITGIPKVLPNQFTLPTDSVVISGPVELTSITKGYPAEKAGLLVGDKITRFAGKDIVSVQGLIDVSRQNKGKQVLINYSRNNINNSVKATLLDRKGGVFGAGLGQRELIKSTWSAPIVGIGTTAQFTTLTFQSIVGLIGDSLSSFVLQFSPDSNTRAEASSRLGVIGESVAGPIGILGSIFPAAQQAGLTQLVFLTAVISVSLAVMNALPIPSLDGGRWVTMAIFRLFKKKLTKEREEKIQTVGFSILMGLVILVTIADVSKIF